MFQTTNQSFSVYSLLIGHDERMRSEFCLWHRREAACHSDAVRFNGRHPNPSPNGPCSNGTCSWTFMNLDNRYIYHKPDLRGSYPVEIRMSSHVWSILRAINLSPVLSWKCQGQRLHLKCSLKLSASSSSTTSPRALGPFWVHSAYPKIFQVLWKALEIMSCLRHGTVSLHTNGFPELFNRKATQESPFMSCLNRLSWGF